MQRRQRTDERLTKNHPEILSEHEGKTFFIRLNSQLRVGPIIEQNQHKGLQKLYAHGEGEFINNITYMFKIKKRPKDAKI